MLFIAAACNQQAAVQPAQNQTITKTDTDPATWKTYTNTKYGFEFEYPADKYLLNGSDGIDFENTVLQSKSDADNMTVYLAVRIETKPFETVRQQLKKAVGGSVPVESAITFAGENGYAFVEKYPGTNEDGSVSVSSYEVLFKHNGTIYYILTQKYNLDEIKLILSSFKFTK